MKSRTGHFKDIFCFPATISSSSVDAFITSFDKSVREDSINEGADKLTGCLDFVRALVLALLQPIHKLFDAGHFYKEDD